MLDREAILDRIRRNLDEVLENKRISEAAAETSEETDEEETK
jgi:hypothetical protein